MAYINTSKRMLVWDTEEKNEKFLKELSIIERDDGCLEDIKSGQNYRIDNIGRTRITLFPLGTRGKRAYIRLDEQGYYKEFTGIV